MENEIEELKKRVSELEKLVSDIWNPMSLENQVSALNARVWNLDKGGIEGYDSNGELNKED